MRVCVCILGGRFLRLAGWLCRERGEGRRVVIVDDDDDDDDARKGKGKERERKRDRDKQRQVSQRARDLAFFVMISINVSLID